MNDIDLKSNILEVDTALMIKEYKEGKQVASSARSSDMDNRFRWMKTFLNCFTGNPNTGKSTFLLFLMTLKSTIDGWKWGIFSPEMISSRKIENKIMINAGDIIDEIVWMKTGKNPFKHVYDRYGYPQIGLDEYMEALEWVTDHFIITHPKDTSYNSVMDNMKYIAETFGTDGLLIDPWKNVRVQFDGGMGTMDNVLHGVFAEVKEMAIMTNQVVNIIAHPKSLQNVRNADKSFKVVSAQDLAGGAAWFNSMDGIYSIHRPNEHEDPNDPEVIFYNLKQRKQDMVARRGKVQGIEFDFKTHRYYFKAICPIDGKNKHGQIATKEQVEIEFQEVDRNELPF